MRKFFIQLMFLLFLCGALSAQKELILNCTGYGFDRNEANGIAHDQYTYLQKFANLTYNGQNASITAIRFYVDWHQYEPTLGDYQGAKLVTAIQTLLALQPGIKIALHFPYSRPGPQPGEDSEGYFTDDDVARTSDGSLVKQTITWTCPSIFSSTGRTRFYAFVNDALSHLSAYYSNILYVEMGNEQAEEFAMPFLTVDGYNYPAFYEQKALDSWRTEYLPCRYPGQSTVTWDGTTYTIASAPSVYPGQWNPWTSDIAKEYHRFASWGLMRFYKGFRDVVKSNSSSLKVIYYVSDFGSSQGNLSFMHSATLPMGLNECDGIYSTDGGQYNLWTKIMALDVIKGTNPNKIAAIEFDQDDLGQQAPSNDQSPIYPNMATEWMARAYKHGADYIHLAMHFNDVQIEQLKPVLAALRTTYLNGSYQSPARATSVPVDIYPTSFTGTHNFQNTWDSIGGDNFSSSDVTPKSISMNDGGYWQNIWSCTASDPCDYNISASVSNAHPATSASISLSYICSGSSCSGVTYSWSGNGASGSGSPLNITAPGTAGTYTYTITASKSGCTAKTDTVQIAVTSGGGGGSNPCGFTDKQTIGTWTLNSFPIQTRLYSVNGSMKWLLVSADPGATATDKHFPRGDNFVTRTDISWNNGAPAQTCFGGGETDWGGLSLPSGIVTPSGYIRDTTLDGSIYFEQSSCTTPSAPTLSASPSTVASGSSVALSASGCSGGTITWSDGLGMGTSKTVNPTSTKTYTAACSIGSCTSSNGSVTVTVTGGGGSPSCGNLDGVFDVADCNLLTGWVYDNSSPNAVVNVDIYEGSTLIVGNVPASNFRQDLVDAGKGNGVHGFSISTPSALKDGQSHSLTIKVTGCSGFSLFNSPRTISSCSVACTTPSAPSLSASPTSITSGSSSTLSASGCSGGTITWSDGLGTGTSKSVSPGSTKTYTATCTIESCMSANGSVTVTVTGGGPDCYNLASNADGANCNWIEGWVCDRTHPNTALGIDIYEGGTLIMGNVPANNFRQDLLDAGYGNGNHGYTIQTPSQLQDGQSHTLTFKVAGCGSYELNSSPRTLSGCSGSPLMLDPTGGNNDAALNKLPLTVSPNPTNGIFDASFYVARGKKATLVVSDMQGRTLYKQTFTGTGEGMHKEKLNLMGKASGTLLVQLYKDSGVETKKLNVIR